MDLSAEDRRTLTEMLVDKIVIAPHPHKIIDGRRHYTIRAITHRLDVCGTRLGSTDQALIMSLSSARAG